MRRLLRSPGYLRWKRGMGYLYVVVGLVLIGRVVTLTHEPAEMLPGLLLGAAFTALGLVRLRSLPT
ncbi:MAG TPA: hypothetical protein VNJ51_04400 [Candidatus Dormibacteraeota bacterium]|nr:hypothetical protein [Candidatus Dormibacteraeota bacterium]